MKCGMIMTARTDHAMQRECWTAARQHSLPETDVYVLWNQRDAEPVPDGIGQLHGAFNDEADLWWFALGVAESRGWDWCMCVHDDFAMREPGWERELALSEGWRVALASWCVHSGWDATGGTGMATHRLGCTLDSMSFGFRPSVFRARGCVTELRAGFGFGAWDACGWALDNGFGVWRILLDSVHQWLPRNSRVALGGVGAPGHQEVSAKWAHLFTAQADDVGIQLGDGRYFRCAPEGIETPSIERTTTCALNDENVIVTDGDGRRHYRKGELVNG